VPCHEYFQHTLSFLDLGFVPLARLTSLDGPSLNSSGGTLPREAARGFLLSVGRGLVRMLAGMSSSDVGGVDKEGDFGEMRF
jgi:hypothetical protein